MIVMNLTEIEEEIKFQNKIIAEARKKLQQLFIQRENVINDDQLTIDDFIQVVYFYFK